ncbi:tumor necrosis factor receptor superfamily member 10D-like isoform X4 [Piliocolobus tephrosceles]|uniref:tumor necrosis factor receptor superfamily member 10D-like isoform X4 n=1 Tax=Piliocolobus tephrosceles TaxID=591936 RepID=UPI000C295D43|nr:tumor necrosis factor receptor superfamily member 10D-like isoform X4 [Piliocolobus tephrosceles]
MGLCGQSAPTASSSGAGRHPGARTASETTSWLRKPKTLRLVLVIFLVLLPVQVDSATISRQDEIPPPPVASQQQRRSLEEECLAGSHRSKRTGDCNPCTEGVDYTNASNSEPSCLPCAVCKSDEEEMSPCTTTSNTVCHCKPGSFRNGNSTEMCQKCSTGCPRGKIMVNDCTPWSDISCTASAASSTGETPAAEDTVPTCLGTPASPRFVLTIDDEWILFVAGGGGDPERVRRPTQVSEQEIQGQELAEPTGVTVQSPEEPQRLLEQAEAEACQRRTLPVPVNDADPTEINTLLDASATLEEGHAKETIQDHMVDSEKLFYEEDDAGFATSSL